jgi:sulfatase maturation enzyme AslB (radical SAM superfamily)
MTLNDIKWLQVENTSNCNLWCPACQRNNNGFGLADNLVVEDLKTTKFHEALLQLPNLEVIQFCGTYGEFAAASNVLEHLNLALQHSKKIQIHTHGSLRNKSWWAALGHLLKDINHDVWFGIDGLEGIHEIHRQGSNYSKVIENATAFIQAGGHATWQFIPFAYNEHQIKECLKLSQSLGFKKFKLVTSVREKLQARHYRTGEVIEFRPWSRSLTTNPYHTIKDRTTLVKADCRHIEQKTVYLNANGEFSPCCFLHLNRTGLPDIEHEIETSPHQLCLRICGNGATLHTHK